MSGTLRILLPTDGAPAALAAIGHALDLARRGLAVELHLLNVQPPVRGAATALLAAGTLVHYHREQGMAALGPAEALCRGAGVVPHLHVGVGEAGATILDFARKLDCGMVVMATGGHGRAADFVLGSVAREVSSASPVPVTLVRAG